MVPKIVQFQTVIPRHNLSPPSTLIHSNENLKNNALLQEVHTEETERQKRTKWDVMAHWLRRLLSTGGSWVRLVLWPSRRDFGQVLYLQLPVRFGVKLRYSIRAVVGSASEW